MRYMFGAGLMLVLLMGHANAQMSVGGASGKDGDWGTNPKADAQKVEADRRNKDVERAYYEVTKKTRPPGAVSNDPWGSIRSSAATTKPKP